MNLNIPVLQGPRGRQGSPGLAGEAGAKGEKVQRKHTLTSHLEHFVSCTQHLFMVLIHVDRETQELVYQAPHACLVPLDPPSPGVYL